MDTRPIGIFDSGVGGLTILSAIKKLLPNENTIYFADTNHFPFEQFSKAELRQHIRKILDFFLDRNVKAVVFAGAISSALALNYFLEDYEMPFIGIIRPTVREAIHYTKNNHIGIITTPSTVKSHSFASYLQMEDLRFFAYEVSSANIVNLFQEEKYIYSDISKAIYKTIMELSQKGIDTLIIGCTHIALFEPIIKEYFSKLNIVSPTESVAREMLAILREKDIINTSLPSGLNECYTTSAPQHFQNIADSYFPGLISDTKMVILT